MIILCLLASLLFGQFVVDGQSIETYGGRLSADGTAGEVELLVSPAFCERVKAYYWDLAFNNDPSGQLANILGTFDTDKWTLICNMAKGIEFPNRAIFATYKTSDATRRAADPAPLLSQPEYSYVSPIYGNSQGGSCAWSYESDLNIALGIASTVLDIATIASDAVGTTLDFLGASVPNPLKIAFEIVKLAATIAKTIIQDFLSRCGFADNYYAFALRVQIQDDIEIALADVQHVQYTLLHETRKPFIRLEIEQLKPEVSRVPGLALFKQFLVTLELQGKKEDLNSKNPFPNPLWDVTGSVDTNILFRSFKSTSTFERIGEGRYLVRVGLAPEYSSYNVFTFSVEKKIKPADDYTVDHAPSRIETYKGFDFFVEKAVY